MVGTESYQTPTEAALLIGFMILWSAWCLLMLMNYRGWLDWYAEKCARSWWARRVTGYSTDTYRSLTRFVAIAGLAIALFVYVAEGIGVANGRVR